MIIRPHGQVVLSASDLTQALSCQWQFVRILEGKLGIGDEPEKDADLMMEITAELGGVHEQRLLEKLRVERGGDVAEIATPKDRGDIEGDHYFLRLEEAAVDTELALTQRRKIVFQGAFFDGEFQGFADFLLWNDEGYYEVYDSKLARKAKVSALLQLAAYAKQLRRLGIPVGNTVHLMLGSGETSHHQLADIEPVFEIQMRKLRDVVEERVIAKKAGFEPVRWVDEAYSFCGSCPSCEQEIASHDDLLQIADIRRDQRAKIMAQGLRTLEAFASHEGVIEGVNPGTLANLHAQAKAQLATRRLGDGELYVDFDRPQGLLALPDPSPGDIFFDFEGDPLYQEGEKWGLDYLFGWVDAHGAFDKVWADSLEKEKQALEHFVDMVMERLDAHPGMHVYHYASYEQTHLLQLAQRHGTREDEVDQLVREHVLVNMLPIVKNSLRLGAPSYSIKYLEKVYLTPPREGEVQNAADSVVDYHNYRNALLTGNDDEAERIKQNILDYNETDCESTRQLFHWLLTRRPGPYVEPVPRDKSSEDDEDPNELRDHLRSLVEGVEQAERTPNDHAIALAAEALDYHRRENRTFWWGHFRRLSDPVPDWENERGVVIAERVILRKDWEKKRTRAYREYEIQGRFAPGTTLKPGHEPVGVYDSPPSALIDWANPMSRASSMAIEVVDAGEDYVVVKESASVEAGLWDHYPMALAPSTPPRDGEIRAAIRAWASRIAMSLPGSMPDDPGLDILRRIPPRATITYPEEAGSQAEAITETLLGLKDSYLAVQGPPGTGKTHNGAQVISNLVARGWNVGVVAQSHAAIDNVLRAVAEAGVDRALIGKKMGQDQTPDPEAPWTWLKTNAAVGEFIQGLPGKVIGGTVWMYCNRNALLEKELDLIVVEEAGQYSLANTIAVSTAAKRLLLLGDPQQLAEVSQGTHPEPINTSALGWLSKDHDVLPRELGIFLDTSRRMHEELCEVVSQLSYEGKLHAFDHPDRFLDGVEPGVHTRPVAHRGNSVESIEEATEVVHIVEEVIAHSWSHGGQTKPLHQWEKNIIVVAPYNAQVNLIRRQLDKAGFYDIKVGTVDKFQGQEAVIAIVSMSASTLDDVPRGIDFLLERNRLNVALSRAQWASYVVYSPGLLDFAPKTPKNLALLSRFAGVVNAPKTGGYELPSISLG